MRQIVSQEDIDATIEKHAGDQQIADLSPDIATILSNENLKILTEEEFGLLTYMLTILSKVSPEPTEDLIENIASFEEYNWDYFNGNSKQSFREKCDYFFFQYQQEDMLAFVEDSLQVDDESQLTTVGRDIIFVTCKSLIDCYCD